VDVVRQAGMRALFGGVYAPSTVGSFQRGFTFGHVQKVQSAAADLLVNLADRVPLLLRQPEVLTFVDVDSVLRRVYGKSKQGAGFGHAKVGGYDVRPRGLNPLIATVSTLDSAPVVAATRMRAGPRGRGYSDPHQRGRSIE
jgi:hypothetical protein